LIERRIVFLLQGTDQRNADNDLLQRIKAQNDDGKIHGRDLTRKAVEGRVGNLQHLACQSLIRLDHLAQARGRRVRIIHQLNNFLRNGRKSGQMND